MALAAYFALNVEARLNEALWLCSLVLMLWALIHAALQRADGFPAIGTLSKGVWLAILGACLALTAITFGAVLIFQLIGIGAAAFYLLDTRRGLKDASDGQW